MQTSRLVANKTQYITRQQELRNQESATAQDTETARKNKKFTQVYDRGWDRLIEMAVDSPNAVRLYAFFAKHLDNHCGAVICDQRFLAKILNTSQSTVARGIAYLEQKSAIVRIPVIGKVCAYALNPNEVWKGYNTSKDYAAFSAKVITLKDIKIKQRLVNIHKQTEHNTGPIVGEMPEQM